MVLCFERQIKTGGDEICWGAGRAQNTEERREKQPVQRVYAMR